MAENNKNSSAKNKSKESKKDTKKIILTSIKFLLVTIFMVGFIVTGAVAGLVIAVAKDAPEVDPTMLVASLNESSSILDADGNLIERIHTDEYRTVVPLDKIPKHVQDAFIAIEDHRFESHKGVDIRRIGGALWADIKARAPVQGASTITQQLVKNAYLLDRVDNENLINDIKRKIQEAYLAIQIERELTKEQILEAYLNKIHLGQEAYGVQAASQIYFSKNVWELSIAEASMIAGITKNPSRFSLYRSIPAEDIDNSKHDVIKDVVIYGSRYTLVYNDSERVIDRKNIILSKMNELDFITEQEYEEAKAVKIRDVLNPKKEEKENISSFFGDYVKGQVLDVFENELGYSNQMAKDTLFGGGLKIYATIDTELQNTMEGVFNNFDQIMNKINGDRSPRLIDKDSFKNENIINQHGKVIFYKKEKLLNENSDLTIDKGTYVLNDNGSLTINNRKLNIYPGTVDIVDYYTVNENNNLLICEMGSLDSRIDMTREDNGKIVISADYLANNNDFYTIDENENLIINSKYFDDNYEETLQPQSAVVIMDYRTGEIKALIGSRDNLEKSKTLNRATKSQRQPGSAIKPLSVYLPALDKGFEAGYTPATVIDDIIHFGPDGSKWPQNWYEGSNYKHGKYAYGYWGLHTLRQSLEQSINVNSVKTLEQIGIKTSLNYLDKLGLSDDIVTSDENRRVNDENLSALGLGGFTKGVTPLNITAAYAAIANKGIYCEPIAFTKIEDKNGNVIYENTSDKNRVVSEQVAYLMSDILESTVSNGLAQRAQFDGANNTKIPAAGKTGTTQRKGDAWFIGYSPYYAAGVWIGNDTYEIKLSEGSRIASHFWSAIMSEVHKGYAPKSFEVPDGIVTLDICTQSGKLAGNLCAHDPRGSMVKSEIFIKGTEPREFCDAHKEVKINSSNGKLANEFCPEELVVTKVLVDRPLPYDPNSPEYLDIEKSTKKIVTIPYDYIYRVPTEVCDEHNKHTQFQEWINKWIENGSNPDEIPEDYIEEMRQYYKELESQENPDNPDNNEGEENNSENGNEEDSDIETIDSEDNNSDGN